MLIADGHFVTKLKNYIACTLVTISPTKISDNQLRWQLLKNESRKFRLSKL